jgi:hypothetical protein
MQRIFHGTFLKAGYYSLKITNMQNRFLFSVTIVLIFILSSCETLKQSSKYQFADGFYKTRLNGKVKNVYVLAGSDTIKAYGKTDLAAKKIDSTKAILIGFPSKKPDKFQALSFSSKTFDIDVLTVLFKYRPPANGFPPQFNATFNGAAYFGYRTDVYKLSYKQTPMHVFNRTVTHYGYSMGVFTGLGTARVDEFDTNNALSIEYDGLVNLSGIALILAVDKLTAGITLGVDHLLDKNHLLWVNNGKAWIGLSIGLNLN